MLGCDLIGCVNGILHRLCYQDITELFQGFGDDVFSGEDFHESIYFFGYFLCQLHAGGDQDGRCHLVMLCLGQQICCYISWIGSLVCQHQDLTRTGDGIDIDESVNCFFCKSYIDVAWPYDLIDFFNRFRTKCQCCDGLGTAYFVDFICTCFVGCHQSSRVDLSFCIARCGHDDLSYTGYLGWYDIHQYRGWVDSLAAWHVDTDSGQGCNLLSQQGTVLFAVKPAGALLLLMIRTDIHQCLADHFDQLRIYLGISFLQFLFCHFDIRCIDLCMIELLSIFKYGFIFAFSYIIHDRSYFVFIGTIVVRASFQ